MKITETVTTISTDKVKKDFTISLLADIHDTEYLSYDLIDLLLSKIKETNPDYILIPGDFVYRISDISNGAIRLKLDYLLTGLSYIAPVLCSRGNHDLKESCGYLLDDFLAYFKRFEKKHDFYLLNNRYESIGRVNFVGVEPVFQNYYPQFKNNWNEYFTEAIINIDGLLKLLTNGGFNIMLTHSPETVGAIETYIYNQLNSKDISTREMSRIIELKGLLKNFDLYVAGHMHDGLIPKWWQRLGIVKGDKGIMASEGSGIKEASLRTSGFCRGVHQIYNGKLVITRGVTKWCQPNPVFATIDKCCAKDIDTIKILSKQK